MVKTQSVVGRETKLAYSKAVIACGIALIAFPIIVGILLVQTHHILIAVSLSQDRGSSYIGILAIALDDTLNRYSLLSAKTIAIDSEKLSPQRESLDSEIHTFDGGIEDVYLIDTCSRNLLHRPRQSLLLDDTSQKVTLTLTHLLGVVEQRVVEVGWKDDRSSKDTTRQAATSRLIAARLQKFVLKRIL